MALTGLTKTAGAALFATFAAVGSAGAQDQQVAEAPGPQQAAINTEIEGVDRRGAILASREGLEEHGGYLVIWYDEVNHIDAMGLVLSLKDAGKENVVALAGRDDGMFQVYAAGRKIPGLFSLEDARNGTLGGEALIFAGQRNVVMNFGDDAPEIVEHLSRNLPA